MENVWHLTCSKEVLHSSPHERLKWIIVSVVKNSAWVKIFWGAIQGFAPGLKM